MPVIRTHARGRAHEKERGQVVVIFAAAMIVLLGLCALVVDVAWYWTNNLRVQRAADAAALAGVVWLPSRQDNAFSVARAEAAKNGYIDGQDGVVVTPTVDPSNARRLRVAISAPVGTYFARVLGVSSWPAHREAKADYVLPVPMGSPQNYYGVGFYEGRHASVTGVDGSVNCGTGTWDPAGTCTARIPGSAPSGGQWAPSGAIATSVQANNDVYAQESTNGERQQWFAFGLLGGTSPVPTPGANQSLVIKSIEVRLSDAFVSATCASSFIGVDLSWDAGSSWTNSIITPNLGTNTSNGDYVLGSGGSTGPWGAHTWARGDLTDANFRVRLTANKGCGTGTTTLNVDQLDVRVIWTLNTTTWTTQSLNVNDPEAGSALATQGFWGAMFTSGGWRENGDKFAPMYLGNGTGLAATTANPTYDAAGYDYTLELPGGSGRVDLFDPMFCATGDNGHGGSFGAGDHWTSPNTIAPVAITYNLYDTQGTVGDITDDGAPVATLHYDPGSATLGDFSGAFGTPQNNATGNRQDCSANTAHNQWVSMASGLVSGFYRLNVNTSLDAANANVGAENLFSIWVKSAGEARVYGGGRMAAYTNLDAGQQRFYFAQVEAVHAGKTMEIHLFDPGESNGNAYLRLLSPDGNNYHRQTFTWTSDDGRSGSGSEIQTSNGTPLFNNREITITVPLPASYGHSGLNPPGDATDEPGWWIIEYELSQGNDTTTWSVDIRGNPVHLVTP